jgi:hypothetical protein
MSDDSPVLEWIADSLPASVDAGAVAYALLALKQRWHNPHITPTVNLKDWLNE